MFGLLDDRKFNGAVAILDVLGFKKRMESLDIESVRDNTIGTLLESTITAISLLQHNLDKFERYSECQSPHTPLNFLYFADSLIIYLPEIAGSFLDSPSKVLNTILDTCCLLFTISMWRSIPLRGAIAYGELIISHNPLFFIGSPLLEAHKLEKKQNWAGVALAESAVSKIDKKENECICKWNVPTYKGQHDDLWVLNWPSICSFDNFSFTESGCGEVSLKKEEINWGECFDSQEYDVEEKRSNTEKFFYEMNETECSIAGNITIGSWARIRRGNWKEYFKDYYRRCLSDSFDLWLKKKREEE